MASKTIRSTRRDRFKHSWASSQRRQGGARKGGGGGKFTWGRPGDELYYNDWVSEHDPNYDASDEYANVVLVEVEPEPAAPVQARFESSAALLYKFKSAVRDALLEYLASADREEFVRCLAEVDCGTVFHNEVALLIITVSLDKTKEERSKLSSLLQYLYEHEVISQPHVISGFAQAYNRLPDLSLDVPSAREQVRAMARRAAAGEVIPEEFVDDLELAAEETSDPERVKQAKAAVRELVDEYFANGSLADLVTGLETQSAVIGPHFHHELVKKAISVSMDRDSRERELTSIMIGSLSGSNPVRPSEVEKAFETLLQRIEDLYNDVPKVLEYMSCFLARAITDEALPPAFLNRIHLLQDDMGFAVVEQAQNHLSQTHAAARMAKVWGAATGHSALELKEDVRTLLKEYFASNDLEEAVRCIVDLKSPFFHHEVVKRLIVLAFDKDEDGVQRAEALVAHLAKEASGGTPIVSMYQLAKGFKRVEDQIDDLKLDSPGAEAIFARLKKAAGMN